MPLPIYLLVRAAVTLSALWTYVLLPAGGEEGQAGVTDRPRPAVLGSIPHDAVPAEDADAWLVPDRAPDDRERLLASMAGAAADGDAKRVLALAPRLTSERDLGGYARLFEARAHFALNNLPEARRAADALARDASSPYLAEQARLLAADAALAALDPRAAIVHLDAVMSGRALAPERALVRLGRAHLLAGDRTAAALAFTRVHYEFALTPEAAEAATELAALAAAPEGEPEGASVDLRLGRAEQLFGARRYDEARAAFEALRDAAGGEQRALVDVRLGQIDYYTGRHAQARAALAPHAARGPRRAEARYFELL
ncbi:MAG TPA: hypothetical protein VFZ36_03150, partial [Vicinamibacterales bacterium]